MQRHSLLLRRKSAKCLLMAGLGLTLNLSGLLCAQNISDSALAQIAALEQEKASFTPAQKKIDSQLVFSLKRSRQEPIARNSVSLLRLENQADAQGLVDVDISANVTPKLLQLIQQCGGQLRDGLQTSPLCVHVPLKQLETIAALPEVKFIGAAVRMRAGAIGAGQPMDVSGVSVLVSDAAYATAMYGVAGGGVKVGVISDSVDFLAAAQAANALGPVTVLPGQSGVPGTGEGTALLEIVHAVAPDAQLFFATSKPSMSQFASNIINLRLKYGCDIIIDDLKIEQETPFQDSPVSQAIATVASNGALYMSSAGNENNLNSGTSGTWEGDFSSDGPTSAPLKGKGMIHSFGYQDYDMVYFPSPYPTELFWSDPWGASTNDYDLFVLDTNGANVVESSINFQGGAQDPYEYVPAPKLNEQLVIVLASGEGRFLHLTTQGGVLAMGTEGATRGHNASTNALTIAAFDATNDIYAGGVSAEWFSSDGPRQMFYYADGTPITPGDVSSSGGAIFPKPDLAGADDVNTTVFNPFYGTSASVANAAGLAALVKSFNPSLTTAQLESVLEDNTSASPPSWGPDLGYGNPEADSCIENAPAYQGAPIISASPVSQQVPLGQSFQVSAFPFSIPDGGNFASDVSAFGAQPLSYQWQKNGTNLTDIGDVSGSSTACLTNGGAFLDAGGSYSVIVSNSLGSVTSMTAIVSYAPIEIMASLGAISNESGFSSGYTAPGVIEGADGKFYGATADGGKSGFGALFSLTPGGQVSELYDFGTLTNDGESPNSLVLGADGNFYGTTYANVSESDYDIGIIFRFTPAGEYTILYYFTNGVDGSDVLCGLSLGKNDVMYGAASLGGLGGSGTIFSVTTSGQLNVLYTFTNGVDGANPTAAPILGEDGYLYGTTSGYSAAVPGTVYKLSPSGRLTPIHAFTNGADGSSPFAGLTLGNDGNFYGVASGAYASYLDGGPFVSLISGGAAFRITPGGGFKVIHSFSPATEGIAPVGKLALGHDGNFYGVATGGGPSYVLNEEGVANDSGFGSAFKMTPAGVVTPLYFFTGGNWPAADLFTGSDGNIYGATTGGNQGFSPFPETVFRIVPNGFGPAIVRQPQNQTVVAGSNALFYVSCDAASPLSYQWQFNGKNIAGAINSSLVVSNVQKSQLGQYRVILRNPVGTVTSSSASLSLGTPPLVSLQPQSQTLASGAKAEFTVTATGSPAPTYQWQANGVNIPGATSATLIIPHVSYTNAGSYSVLVSNPVSATMSSNAFLTVVPSAPIINFPAAGFQSPSNSITVVGKTGSLGVTNILFQFAGGALQPAILSSNASTWSAFVPLSAGTNSFQVVAQNALGTSLPAMTELIFNPFINASGVYDGLFLDTNNPSLQSVGSVALTVSSTRSFSGKITRAADVESFTGQFDLTGTAQLTLAKAKPAPIGLNLVLDLDPGALAMNGLVSNRGAFSAPLTAWRTLTGASTNYPPFSTFVIVPSVPAEGYSYGVVHVNPGGNFMITTYLLDGTTFSANGSLLQNGQFPLFAPLYKGGGWLISWVNAGVGSLSASVDWFHTNGVIDTNLSLSGLVYPPHPTSPVLVLTNGGFELFGASISGTLSNSISISARNVITPGTGDIEGLSVTLNAASGTFGGSFDNPSTGKPIHFQGGLMPGANSGFGYFTESNHSGAVIMGNFPLLPFLP
jgi:uncharacterized repeat protein (TIGR03803 family)